MDVKPYIGMINKVMDSGHLFCTYCGAETAAAGAGICSECESPIYYTRDELQGSSPDLVEKVNGIRQLEASGKYGEAAAAYDALVTANPDDPNMLYAAGAFYLRYSNNEIRLIRYDLPGFMEQNPVHRVQASQLVIKAKIIFNKAVYVSEGRAAKGGFPARDTYIEFMAQIKMMHLREANALRERLGGLGDAFLARYADLVFNASAENYDYVMQHAAELLSGQPFSLNAAFYLALALFKKKRYADSAALLNVLRGRLSTSNVGELLNEIATAKSL